MKQVTTGRRYGRGLLLGLTLVLSGCQGVQFSTNLGQLGPSLAANAGVKEYGQAQLNRDETAILGSLRGEGCVDRGPGLGLGDRQPPEFDRTRSRAIAELKHQAAALGGNGIVLHRCQDQALGVAGCHYASQCEATAILVSRDG
ncbi:hypothetical protein [Ferrimonas marina]|uniref:Outer membrane lipoprotein RcsF n=1 Tax=Ferrimonas marina TaxID=299255 RepID=A0A1M5ZB85_9GAMM|nr:hypothetical protein [Ferrimonas marina]SHI21484.1 hypothetical protein SAMN02745129_0142 [Ferrimonas marina]